MKKIILNLLIFLFIFSGRSCSATKSDFSISSPNGKITAALKYDKESGAVYYNVISQDQEIISKSPIGIYTDRGDFTEGMELRKYSEKTIDEIYHLPHGKVSTYRNHANELILTMRKKGQDMNILFRVYDDGIAFGFEVPGEGEIELKGEINTINLSGENFVYYGQNHPNRYGYESALGPIDGQMMSIPVLAHLKDRNHFVLMGQAATYGHYIQPHFDRLGSSFKFSFPLDQEKIGPVRSSLPFKSPWRMVIISPNNPGKIVESYLPENLNPPTNPFFLNPDGTIKKWVRPGRAMWDFIAGDRDKPRMWIDAVAEMGWEYYLADAGFEDHWGGSDSVKKITQYAASKNVEVIGWAHTREFNTPAKAEETMTRYADLGLKGAKIDFFNQNTFSENPREWRDYEDTQQSLQMRDWIFEAAYKNSMLLEFHGSTIPTGERRQYPNLMTVESVDGMERRDKPATNDLTIPYVRNVMGPVSYTVIHFERCPGTQAYQLAMPIVYEAGLMIYAEHGLKLLSWQGRELIQELPSAWDETKYLEGMPATYIVIARRNDQNWYIAGMTNESRTVTIPLNFLEEGKKYDALVFRDKTHTTMYRENKMVENNSTISIDLLERGGFALRLRPKK